MSKKIIGDGKEIKEYNSYEAKEFKQFMIDTLNDYIEVKKVASDLGYDVEKLFKWKDYMEYYVRLNDSQ